MRTDTEDLPVLDRGILREPKRRHVVKALVYAAIVTVAAVALIIALANCGQTVPTPVVESQPHGGAPIHGSAKVALDWLPVLGLLGIAVGVAMLIWIPIKRFGISVIASSIALIVADVWLVSLLPYVKWLPLVTLVGALGWVGWLVYQKRKHLNGSCPNPSALVKRWVDKANKKGSP